MERHSVFLEGLLVEMEKGVCTKSTAESEMKPPKEELCKGRPCTNHWWPCTEHGPSCRSTLRNCQSYRCRNNTRVPNRQPCTFTRKWRMKSRVIPAKGAINLINLFLILLLRNWEHKGVRKLLGEPDVNAKIILSLFFHVFLFVFLLLMSLFYQFFCFLGHSFHRYSVNFFLAEFFLSVIYINFLT